MVRPVADRAPLFDPAVVRFGLRQIFRTRKFMIAALVSAVPVIAGIIMLFVDVAASAKPDYTFDAGLAETTAFVILGGTVPFVALLMAGGMLADEAEDRTLTYLLVRPIRRSTLYVSKLLPVLLVTAGLAAVQALLLGIMRLLAFGLAGSDATEELVGGGTISSGALIALTVPAAAGAAALVGIVLAAVFGVVTLLTTRFHFFANLLVYLVWELGFGLTGGGLGRLTVLRYGMSFLDQASPSVVGGGLMDQPSGVAFSLFWLLLWLVLWALAGAAIVRRRDFNITSAAS